MSEVFLKMFGVCIGFSVLRIFFRQNFVQERVLTKIVIGFFLFNALHLLFFENFLLNWFLIYGSVLLILGLKFFFDQRQENLFRKEFPVILTSILLNMKLGQSFRQSLRTSLTTMTPCWRTRFELIYQNVAFSPQENGSVFEKMGGFSAEIAQELKKIDGSTHKTIEKIENFRRRLMITEKFRRRSGRVRGQVHLQIILMSLIYAAVFAINAFMFPLERYKLIVLVSVFAYLFGLVVIFMIGKRVRWNI